MSAANVHLLAWAFAGWGKDDPANMRDVLHSGAGFDPVRGARAKNGKAMDVHNVWIYEFSESKVVRGRV